MALASRPLVPSRLASRARPPRAGGTATHQGRRLRRARPSPGSSSCCWSRRCPRWSSPARALARHLARDRHAGRRHAGRRRRQRHQHVRRPRHRPADAPHPAPAARDRRGRAPGEALVFAVALEVAAFVWLWLLVNLLSAVLALVGHALLRLRVHAVAQAHVDARTSSSAAPPAPCRCWSGWAAVTGSPGVGAGRAVRSSSSCGRRRTSGRSPSATPTTTAPPTCRCCPRSSARAGPPARSSRYTVALVAASLLLVPVADLGAIYTVAAVVVGARVHRRWPSGSAASPPRRAPMRRLRLLDLLRHPAVRGHGRRRPRAVTEIASQAGLLETRGRPV